MRKQQNTSTRLNKKEQFLKNIFLDKQIISEHKADKRGAKKEESREIESSTLLDYRIIGSVSAFLIKEVLI